MYCSGCGQALVDGQSICAQCGRPALVPLPAVPGLQFQLETYASRVKALAVVWLVYAGISLLVGIASVLFANAILSGHLGPWANAPWMHGPWMGGPWRHDAPPFPWVGPALLGVVWMVLVIRTGLALLTGWGLLHHTGWGRIVAIIAAILGMLKFPLGTALGIWTLVMLLGYRNTTLYEQL